MTAFFGDFLAYRYGRRLAIWTRSVLIIAGALLNALSKNKGQFIGGELFTMRFVLYFIADGIEGRVLLGSGGSITKVGAPALLQEIAHPRLRPITGACYHG